jgi:hypothetical protein
VVVWVDVEDGDRVWSEWEGEGEAGFALGLDLKAGCWREDCEWARRPGGKERACRCW